jgi:hypothetical protein
MAMNEDGSPFRTLAKTTQVQCSGCGQWHDGAVRERQRTAWGEITRYRAYCNACQLVLEYATLDRALATDGPGFPKVDGAIGYLVNGRYISEEARARLERTQTPMAMSDEEKAAKTAFMVQFRQWWQHADHFEAGRPYVTLAYVIDRILDPIARGWAPPDDIWRQLQRVWEQAY